MQYDTQYIVINLTLLLLSSAARQKIHLYFRNDIRDMLTKVWCAFDNNSETKVWRFTALLLKDYHLKIWPMIPPKLLHVFPSFSAGGIQMRLATIVAGLPAHWMHDVLALNGDYSAFDGGQWPSHIARADIVAPSSGNIFSRVVSIRQQVLAHNPDVLITNNWGAMEWAIAARLSSKIPHIHTESGFGPDEATTLNTKRSRIRRFVLPGAHAVLLCSQTLVEIARTQWHLPQARTLFVPDGIDLSRFGSENIAPMALAFKADVAPKTIVGCVAPLRAEKNLTALLDAFEIAWQADQSLGLAIAGDGSERSDLEAHARGLPCADSILFTGFLSDIERFYASIDLCALSSDTEQLPNSILQAMAARRPIAAFGVGDVALMVAPENASYIVPRRDVAGLASAISTLAADPKLRAAVGTANGQHCQAHYGQAAMVAAYQSAIETVLRQVGRTSL